MDRVWFLTWTTYGTWLPGDSRGSITTVRDDPGPRQRHNQPDSPIDPEMLGLRRAAQAAMKGPPVYLIPEQAKTLLDQFQETAQYRSWLLLAVAIMRNHCHVVVGVPGDPDPEVLLRDFKSYGSRALNRRWPKPVSGTWWTESGSRRKRSSDAAVQETVDYVTKRQEFPLVTWPTQQGERGALAP